jgi:glycosyltransferase involved in cell wall biosynthesis
MNRVLVIAPQPFFSPRGTPFSVYYRTLVMSEMGMRIDLVTYGEGQDVDIPNVRIHRTPRFPFLGPVKIGPSPLKLFLDIFVVFKTIRLLVTQKYDLVHAHEEAVFFCSLLKSVFGFKLIYDMHSSLPQQLTNFEFTTSKAVILFFKYLEDMALRKADAVITICPDLANYVARTVKNKRKHVMIENSIFEKVKLAGQPPGVSYNSPLGFQSLIDKIAEHPKAIVYAGTLEPYQGIDMLIDAFRIVQQQATDAFLVIAGGTRPQIEAYRQKVSRLGFDDVVKVIGRVPQPIAQALCRHATVQVSPRSAGTNTPLKIYEQLASGVPLVATKIYSHTQTIDEEVAFLVEPTPEGIARGLLQALESDGDAKRISEAAQQRYRDWYSRPVYEKKMKRIFRILGLCVESPVSRP